MCSTCGCEEGEIHIEGDDYPQTHHHSHQHGHEHSHGHSHSKKHHEHDDETIQIVHHHYYHQGNVEHHYHYHISNINTEQVQGHCHPHDHKHAHHHTHDDQHEHFHPTENTQGDLDYGHGEAGAHASGLTQKRMFEIEMNVLNKNNKIAVHNRDHFNKQHILALNLVSSPGSGKTSLLTETLMQMKNDVACAVIEGDQQTSNDADRIRATGVPAIQVNTGKGCHLDAQMVHDATHRLQLQDNSLLFIENVGNLVCPAGFDLGERAKVVVLSVTEGEDKPLKYPHMFAAAKLMLINKIDLLPHVDFNVEACIANARKVNPKIMAILVSATSGEGMKLWTQWINQELAA